ncbi:MAG: minimal chain-length factor beta [Trebonia sp.]|nr:minimal chain-length factor beta [Trebonia sp.]
MVSSTVTSRTVVTGLGVVAPTGADTGSYWRATLAGHRGIDRISRFDATRYPVRLAGEVRGADPAGLIDPRILVQTDLWTHLALLATREAVAAAALDTLGKGSFDIGVTTAAGPGGCTFGQREIQALWSQGPGYVGPYQSIAWFYAASTGQISIGGGFRGPCAVLSSESAGGLDAIALSRRAIRRGNPVQVCGGTEAPIAPYALVCQMQSGLLSDARDAAGAYVPFGRSASGYVLGEGGAVLVLEELAHARERGAPALAEITGHTAAFAAGPPPHPEDADGWARTSEALTFAISGALADAGIEPPEVDAVFADGMGVRNADRAEVAALQAVLGEHARAVPVTVPKAGTGRACSGAAPLDVAAAVLALRDGMVPPTPGTADLAHDIDLVTGTARRKPLQHVLCVARGFGGFTSALVVSSAEGCLYNPAP